MSEASVSSAVLMLHTASHRCCICCLPMYILIISVATRTGILACNCHL